MPIIPSIISSYTLNRDKKLPEPGGLEVVPDPGPQTVPNYSEDLVRKYGAEVLYGAEVVPDSGPQIVPPAGRSDYGNDFWQEYGAGKKMGSGTPPPPTTTTTPPDFPAMSFWKRRQKTLLLLAGVLLGLAVGLGVGLGVAGKRKTSR